MVEDPLSFPHDEGSYAQELWYALNSMALAVVTAGHAADASKALKGLLIDENPDDASYHGVARAMDTLKRADDVQGR